MFLPLWVFHGTVSRGRFSLPAPSPPHDRHVCSALLPSCNGFIVELVCSRLHGPGFEENRDFLLPKPQSSNQEFALDQ